MPSGVELYVEYRLTHGSRNNITTDTRPITIGVRLVGGEVRFQVYPANSCASDLLRFVDNSKVHPHAAAIARTSRLKRAAKRRRRSLFSTNAPSTMRCAGAKRARRIRGGRVAGEQQSLAAATAKIFRALIATAAWFRHPFFSAKTLEGRDCCQMNPRLRFRTFSKLCRESPPRRDKEELCQMD